MTPPARVQAAIELLDLIIAAARENGAAADSIVADWFRARRFAGSSDRRAIRELVYRAIRGFGIMPKNGRVAMVGLAKHDKELSSLFDGSNYGPTPIERAEQRVALSPLAPWLASLIAPEEQAALLERAPLDVRVNRLRASRGDLISQFPDAEPIEYLADGMRLRDNIQIEQHEAWRSGSFEVQDAGSQWIAQACGATPGMTIVDLCAGAGGKSLALASTIQGDGRLIATDTNRDRIQRLPPRAERAGADIETRLLDPGKEMEALGDLVEAADLVLVDAPCSGSGTWRRNPEARWRLTSARLVAVRQLQAYVLKLGAGLAKPGGSLVYAVCSLIESEGKAQIESFLSVHKDWQAVPLDLPVGRPCGEGHLLSPHHDATDGFFIARLLRSC